MTPEKARAIWAIYVWCRRTDELVDGPNAARITPEVRQGGGLEGLFAPFTSGAAAPTNWWADPARRASLHRWAGGEDVFLLSVLSHVHLHLVPPP